MRAEQIFGWLVLGSAALYGQSFEQRGFAEFDFFVFPMTVPNDSSHAVASGLVRYEASDQLTPWLTLSGGLQGQLDSHEETDKALRLDWDDRGLLRPLFSIRSLQVTLHKGHFSADIGKQFIHWGKADILNPTDHFGPHDYLNVVDPEPLGVWAMRVNGEYQGTSVDAVWTPHFTPSRMPLIDQRWALLPPGAPPQVENAASVFPGGGQFGVRVNHLGNGYEVSANVFDGFNNLPLLNGLAEPATLYVQRIYPKILSFGTDAAIPLSWFTIKAEAAAYEPNESSSHSPRSDSYMLYVLQAERQIRQWVIAAGYAGETDFAVHSLAYFDPERGLSRSFLAKAVYNLDAPTSISIETAVRQNGAWVTAEYSRQIANHWRLMAGITAIAGEKTDFLGEYRRNSFGIIKLRYSF